MKCFRDDDEGYLQWIADNPHGFVVNTRRQPDPNYLILHHSKCNRISGTPSGGKKWTEEYIKICSLDRMELENCLEVLLSGRLKPCTYCKFRLSGGKGAFLRK
jgi:hypothetical protein